ncbi:DNA-binding transcriptional LysR family regulator [Pararhizobium capsulatum DSM 1112]|uniref:DNA-binding transcriptional LysR family regulator n=1 Tax=Pararhizobium capsulatum DSM 1112 TaxID=1121113 RepID=A0ABU0BYM4_9HYPH|nr:LysR family transcriptional regulator [Pararhizobium capsulatum]MDQ0322535.1 DNA-binding transcriptional LysR family regulator [Pararhizobium capsulatum DSM 1112]
MIAPRRRFVWELDWNLLRTFMVIAEEKSLTAAGDRLSLKQPTISNALRRLEEHMACRLIERSANHFRLTPAGERLQGACLTMFDLASGLPDLVSDDPDQVTGHVDMAFASHIECPFLDRFLAEFHQTFPRVSFSTTVLSSQDVTEAVLANDACLGICLSQEKQPELDYRPLYREHFGFFCGPGHPLFGRQDVAVSDLATLDYVSFRTDHPQGALAPIARLRRRENFNGHVAGLFTNLEEVKRLIKIGFGFGPLPIHVVSAEVAAGELWQLPPYDNPPAVDVYVVNSPRAHRSKAETLLLEKLIAAIDMVPLAERTYPQSLVEPAK